MTCDFMGCFIVVGDLESFNALVHTCGSQQLVGLGNTRILSNYANTSPTTD